MKAEHHIVYIPGLKDQSIGKHLVKLLPRFWDNRGFPIHVVFPHWEEGTTFTPKLNKITEQIDQLISDDHRVSVIGQSAGGSAGLNAFCLRKDVMEAAINVTGRLREGMNVRPTLEEAASKSPAFKESVLLFERENEIGLTGKDRKRVLTIRPWWDEVVPAATVPLQGATNLVAPMVEHSLGGIYVMSVYSKVLQDFLKRFD